jgi:uncharacterized protein YndB with AHSA1/START domain
VNGTVAESVVRFESEVVVARPVGEVFARLADLPDYRRWMHRTGMFRRCSATSDDPVGKGTTYVDATRMGTFEGEVTEFDPPHRIAFSETRSWFGHPMTRARPGYMLEVALKATVVHNVGVGELYGWLSFMQPAAAAMAKLERTKTLNSLKRSFEVE